MANDTRIRNLTAATGIAGTDMLVLDQGSGAAKRVTINDAIAGSNARVGLFNARDYGLSTSAAAAANTLALQAAYDAAFASATGGIVEIPGGTYDLENLNCSQATNEWDKHVRIVGNNSQATVLRFNTTGVAIDLIGAPRMQLENLYITSGTSAPSVGLLLARSTTADNGGNNVFRNLFVWGNFTQACVASLAVESALWEGCVFNNTNADGGVSFFLSSQPIGIKNTAAGGYEEFTVASTNGTILASSNTDNAFVKCNFYGYGTNNLTLSVEASAQASFYGCGFLPTGNGATSCVLISAEQTDPFNGPLNFNGCLFEADGDTHGIELYATGTDHAFYHLNIRDCYFNLYGSGQYSVTYSGTYSGLVALYDFTYDGNTRATTVEDAVRVDYLQWGKVRIPNGVLVSKTGYNFCTLNAEQYSFLVSPELMTFAQTRRRLDDSNAVPVTGIYFIGERVWNSEPAAEEWIGWVAQGYDGGGYSASRGNSTAYTVGNWLIYSDLSVWEVTAGTGTSAGSEPSLVGKTIGSSLTDGDFTLIKRANYPTFFKGFGVIESA